MGFLIRRSCKEKSSIADFRKHGSEGGNGDAKVKI